MGVYLKREDFDVTSIFYKIDSTVLLFGTLLVEKSIHDIWICWGTHRLEYLKGSVNLRPHDNLLIGLLKFLFMT